MMKDEPYGVRAVERAVGVLGALAASDRPQTLTEIAGGAGLSLPTAFRLLRTLQAGGLVMAQPGGGRYTLGVRVLELANALLRQLDIVSVARPFLAAAHKRLDETVCLAVRSGDAWVAVDALQSSQPVRQVFERGKVSPLYPSATGRVLLAGESDEEVDAYLARTPLVSYSAATVTDPDLVRAEIREVRARGYSWSGDERRTGGAAACAPIRGHDGRVIAALLIAPPASRFTDALRDVCIETALEAARGISQALLGSDIGEVPRDGAAATGGRPAPALT
jgi:DNA-binding IclR family transcriptional regulator